MDVRGHWYAPPYDKYGICSFVSELRENWQTGCSIGTRYRQHASTSPCLSHTNSLRSGTHGEGSNIANITWKRVQILQILHGGCYKYCKYCATGSFANILPCQILFHSGVPNCVTSKKASESFDLIALGKCNKFHSSHALQYQKYSNHTSCPLVH